MEQTQTNKENIVDEVHGPNLAHKSKSKSSSLTTFPLQVRVSSSNNTNVKAKVTQRNKMTTMRRLSDSDVRSIFECLHENKQPPANLSFKIVPVGPNGLKLSPPSYEFEDGLYVLLKPQKKNEQSPDYSKVPPQLRGCIMTELPPENCPWSLSGPQFPGPTAIQQRYCYPKGKADYASQKGGALWTMYGADNKEMLEFRLLHVYFSAKRAVNKGVPVPNGAISDDSYSPPASKRTKRAATRGGANKPKRNAHRTPHRRGAAGRHVPTASPAITASASGSSNSPTSLESLPVPPRRLNIATAQPNGKGDMPPLNNHQLIDFGQIDNEDAFLSRQIYPVGTNEMENPYGDGFASNEPISVAPFPFAYTTMAFGPGIPTLQPAEAARAHPKVNHRAIQHPGYALSQVNHSMMMFTSDQDLHNLYLSDPLITITTNPSMDYSAPAGIGVTADEPVKDDIAMEDFAGHLNTLHKSLREKIDTAPSGEKAAMVSALASWARQVAKEPLGTVSEMEVEEEDKKPAAVADVKMEE